MKKTIYQIVNNYGSTKDGIGNYGQVVGNELKTNNTVQYFSSNTLDKGTIGKLLSRDMYKCFDDVSKVIKEKDCVIVEYPFVDTNPFVYRKMKKLYKQCNKVGAFLFLSLHEYERTNFIRKWTIRKMVKYCHAIFVTKESQKQLFSKIHPTYIRNIPTNIKIPEYSKAYNKTFVFFGLINKAKAFDEMIEGWKKFHEDNKEYLLKIVSSSIVNNQKELEDYGIVFHNNASESEVAEEMIKSSFSILPIIPFVSKGNASFWTSLSAGCIPVGIFDDANKSFSINMQDYSPDEFVGAFKKCVSLDEKTFIEKSDINKNIGSLNSIGGVVKTISNVMDSFIEGNQK